MKAFLLLIPVIAFAADTAAPGLPDSILKDYWHAIAAHHAQAAALSESKTPQQKQMELNIAQTDREIEEIRTKLRAACPKDKPVLDESGANPVCAAKPSAPIQAENKAGAH